MKQEPKYILKFTNNNSYSQVFPNLTKLKEYASGLSTRSTFDVYKVGKKLKVRTSKLIIED